MAVIAIEKRSQARMDRTELLAEDLGVTDDFVHFDSFQARPDFMIHDIIMILKKCL